MASLAPESEEPEEVAAAALKEEYTDCAICFEALDSKGGAIPLPCDCRVPYCAECWDRALAASISACGRALCPSCRGGMRVDFDASSGRLKFSRGSELGSDEADDDWRKRLYAQALPKQIELLRRFGAQRTASAQLENESSAGEGQPSTSSGASQATAVEPARCVCGCCLAEVSVRDRVLIFVQEEAPITPPPSVLQHLMMSPPIMCDLCGRRLRPSSKVWTCENGRRTMLHAAAYDVCESCFVFHAYGIEDAEHQEDDEEYGSDDGDMDEYLCGSDVEDAIEGRQPGREEL